MVIEYGIKNGMGRRPAIELTKSTVPRSRSRVIARPVSITMVMVRITPIRPGTML